MKSVVFALTLAIALSCDAAQIAVSSSQRLVSQAYFGTHFHRLMLSPGEKGNATSWPANTIGSIRLWDSETRWADIEEEQGVMRFERLDFYVKSAAQRGTEIVYVMGSTPEWASARPRERCPYGSGCAAEPRNLRAWEVYARAVARRYRGRIQYYEVWNEPKFSDLPGFGSAGEDFFTGSAASMVDMTRIVRAVLNREDPSAKLLTPGFDTAEMLDLFLRSGGKQYVDIISYHFYADDAMQFVQEVAKVRAVMAKNGVAKLPLWNTESGFEVVDENQASWTRPADAKKLSRSDAAAMMAQTLVLGAALGLERFFHYSWDGERFGMLRPDSHSWTPSYFAYLSVRRWLLGATMQGCNALKQGIVECLAERDGKHLAIYWTSTPKSAEVDLIRLGRLLSIEQAISGNLTKQGQSPSMKTLNADLVPIAVWYEPPLRQSP